MFTKTKVGLLAVAALFSLSAVSNEHHKGFYVQVEFEDEDEDVSVEGNHTKYTLEFCQGHESNDSGHKCKSINVFNDKPQFVSFDWHDEHDDDVYLKQVKIKKHHRTHRIDFTDKGTADCSVDLSDSASSSDFGHGYPLLEIEYEEEHRRYHSSAVLECENGSIYWKK